MLDTLDAGFERWPGSKTATSVQQRFFLICSNYSQSSSFPLTVLETSLHLPTQARGFLIFSLNIFPPVFHRNPPQDFVLLIDCVYDLICCDLLLKMCVLFGVVSFRFKMGQLGIIFWLWECHCPVCTLIFFKILLHLSILLRP